MHLANAFFKTHRRDQLVGPSYRPAQHTRFLLTLVQIEWIKGLLAVPFVLLSQPTALFGQDGIHGTDEMARNAHVCLLSSFRCLALDTDWI